MVLDERALKAFVLVAQTGSMSKAAERLSVSVSTISRLLGKVESMAGTELFVSGSRTKLSNAGHLYLMEVLELLDAHKRLERFGAKYRLTGKPLLRIAAFTRYAEPVVVPLAARLIQNFQNGDYGLTFTLKEISERLGSAIHLISVWAS